MKNFFLVLEKRVHKFEAKGWEFVIFPKGEISAPYIDYPKKQTNVFDFTA